MLRKFGWFYYFMGMGRSFGRVRFDDHAVDRIRTASSQGPVVYVMPNSSTVDHLVLNAVLNRRRLPLSVWANGAVSFFWQPVAAAWRDLLHRWRCFFREGPAPDPIHSGWVTGRIDQGDSITIFLDQRATLWQRLHGQEPPNALEALIRHQEDCDVPIQLVPAVVFWDRSPDRAGSVVRDFLVGARQASGFAAEMTRAWLRSGDATVQVGEAVALPEFNARVSPERRARALHALLRRYLHRESRVLRGPTLLPHAVMRSLVLDNPPMRKLAAQEAKALGQPIHKVRKSMVREYDAVAARFRFWVIRALALVLRPLWTRVFSGVDVRPEDLETIRQAIRQGSAVLVPCHKSHLDYVLMSWVFFRHDLMCPHVVAGNNLAIWPLSMVLRRAGGFFVQRSFVGERIHPAIFSRYLRELLHHGYPVEFFIEGGRTRSGKLMRPRTGVLGMVLDAAELRPTGREITLLPIALAYEQVAEESSYARELGGEHKAPETIGALLRSTAIIRRRFGRVYLRVGRPLACSELVEGPPGPRWSDRDSGEKHEFLQRVGQRIVHRIGEAMVVLPTCIVAAALLSHHRQGIRNDELTARALRFRVFLQRRGALEAASMSRWDPARGQALDRFVRGRRIQALELDGHRIWSVLPEQRITLAFYQNQVLHFFAPAALAATCIRRLPADSGVHADDLIADFAQLVWMLRREFIFDPDQSAHDLLLSGLAHLVDHGALSTATDGIHNIVDTGRIAEIYALTRPLMEAYRLVLAEGHCLRAQHPETRDWIRTLQKQQQALVTSGRITRPEALSLVNLQNAMNSFIDEGVLRRLEGRLHDVPDRRETLLNQLNPMVP
jgi:glycerol-3-phosphate O-acyltransferase